MDFIHLMRPMYTGARLKMMLQDDKYTVNTDTVIIDIVNIFAIL